MNEVPELKDEIERKALEALERIYLDREIGKTTEAQYNYALDMLWLAVAGLAGADFTVIMEIARKGRQDASRYTREYLRSPKGAMAKITNFHDGRVMLSTWSSDGFTSNEKMYDFREEPNQYKRAKDMFLAISDTLTAKGFEEF